MPTPDATLSTTSRKIRVAAKADGPEALAATVQLTDAAIPPLMHGQVLIKVSASGVNPSDVKAVLGAMPHAVWPRTPGRDYAGVVLDGPPHLIGLEVWGSGGELGIRRDGAHGEHLILNEGDVREKPAALTLKQAGAIGVPFITAFEGLREAGSVRPGDIVLVLGANGKVGQATAQLASAAGARVFGVERKLEAYRGHASSEVTMLAGDAAWDVQLRDATGGHGADIVYNTVGSPYFEMACRAMALQGRQIFISTIERAVPFDIFTFYRGRNRFIGIDTLALDSRDGAVILDQLREGFDNGNLKPFPVLDANVYPLDRAAAAYEAVLRGAPDRVILIPEG